MKFTADTELLLNLLGEYGLDLRELKRLVRPKPYYANVLGYTLREVLFSCHALPRVEYRDQITPGDCTLIRCGYGSIVPYEPFIDLLAKHSDFDKFIDYFIPNVEKDMNKGYECVFNSNLRYRYFTRNRWDVDKFSSQYVDALDKHIKHHIEQLDGSLVLLCAKPYYRFKRLMKGTVPPQVLRANGYNIPLNIRLPQRQYDNYVFLYDSRGQLLNNELLPLSAEMQAYARAAELDFSEDVMVNCRLKKLRLLK